MSIWEGGARGRTLTDLHHACVLAAIERGWWRRRSLLIELACVETCLAHAEQLALLRFRKARDLVWLEAIFVHAVAEGIGGFYTGLLPALLTGGPYIALQMSLQAGPLSHERTISS